MLSCSALAHGNRAGGAAATLTAFAALGRLPETAAHVCHDLIRASLDQAARLALEDELRPGQYEYQSDFARHYFGEGRARGQQEGREVGRLDEARDLVLALAARHGAVSDDLRGRVGRCAAVDELRAVAVELAGVADLAAAEHVLARLPASTARDE